MLKKILARSLPLAGLVILSCGLVLAQDWQRFTSTEGRFSVLLPETPEHNNTTRDDPQWGRIATHSFDVTTFDSIYTVAYVEYPPKVRLDLDREGEKSLRDYLKASKQNYLQRLRLPCKDTQGLHSRQKVRT